MQKKVFSLPEVKKALLKTSKTLIFTKFQISFSGCRCSIILHPALQRIKSLFRISLWTFAGFTRIKCKVWFSKKIKLILKWVIPSGQNILVVRFLFWCLDLKSYWLRIWSVLSHLRQAGLLCCSLTTLSLRQLSTPTPVAYVTSPFNWGQGLQEDWHTWPTRNIKEDGGENNRTQNCMSLQVLFCIVKLVTRMEATSLLLPSICETECPAKL